MATFTYIYFITTLLGCAICLTQTPTPTSTPQVLWQTRPSVINPDQRFTIEAAHPYGFWNDPDYIGFAKQEIDIMELQRSPSLYAEYLPGIVFCNSSNIPDPLQISKFGSFPQLSRQSVIMSNLNLNSGQYSVCYSDNFGWHPMPKTLVVLGPAAYTTVPSSLIVAQGFQLWIYGEQLSAGDQWGIAKKGSACSNQEFVLKGTLDYQEVNLPMATRAIVEAGKAPATGSYTLCYKYRTANWFNLDKDILVEPETLVWDTDDTSEDGASLAVGLVIFLVIFGLLLCVGGTVLWYYLWSKHNEKLEDLRQQKAAATREEIQNRATMGSLAAAHKLPGIDMDTGDDMDMYNSPTTSNRNLLAPNQQQKRISLMLSGDDVNMILEGRSPMKSPSMKSPMSQHGPTMAQPLGGPGSFTNGAPPGMETRKSSNGNTQYYYDPTTGNYWAYIQNQDGQAVPAEGQPPLSPGSMQQQQPTFLSVMPEQGQNAPQPNPLSPQYSMGSMTPSAANPLAMASMRSAMTAGSFAPAPRKGNWVKPTDTEMTQLESMRQQKRMLEMNPAMNGTMYMTQNGQQSMAPMSLNSSAIFPPGMAQAAMGQDPNMVQALGPPESVDSHTP